MCTAVELFFSSWRNAPADLGLIVCKRLRLNGKAKRLTSAMCLRKKHRWTMLVLAFWHPAGSWARSTPRHKEKVQRSYFKMIARCQFWKWDSLWKYASRYTSFKMGKSHNFWQHINLSKKLSWMIMLLSNLSDSFANNGKFEISCVN